MTSPKPVCNPGITMREVGDETMLHDSAGAAIHVLNPTAKLIWELCDGAHTPAEMETQIRARFDVPAGHDVLQDIERTLEIFAAKGLLIER